MEIYEEQRRLQKSEMLLGDSMDADGHVSVKLSQHSPSITSTDNV